MNLFFLDFESYLNSKEGYTLKKMSMVEYIRDFRFKVHGVGLAKEDDNLIWIGTGDSIFQQNILWSEVTVVAHNVKFDGFILKEKYGIQPKSWVDTKAMARAVLGRRVEDYSLRTLAKYFGLPEKGQMKTDGIRDLSPEQEEELSSYCKHDVWLCREIFNRLKHEFPQSQYEAMSQTIQMFVDPKLVLNVPLLERTAKEEKVRKEQMFLNLGIDKKEFSSNQKFSKLLVANGYRVPMKKSPRTGEAIPALALGDPQFLDILETMDEKLKTLCEARKEAKSTLTETRSERLAKIGRTGSWPFDIEFSGAVQTHRFSGGSGAGGNPQNFTRDSALRKSVTAPKNYSLVVGDFSNIEARLVAYLSGDPGLIQAFERNEDLYCNFGSAFFRRKITKEDDKERRFSKSAILGLGYGMGPTKFQNTVRLQTSEKIDKETAMKAVKLYRAMYNKVPALWNNLNNSINWMLCKSITLSQLPVRYGFESLELPSGLKLQYPGLRKEDNEWVYDVWGKKGQKETTKLYGGKLLENICQALAGEICKEVMVRFADKVVGQVHDEIILVSDNPLEDRAELETAMEKSPDWLPNLKLKAEVSIGDNWLSTKG